jgi:putative Mg2+ transporter-C (MgtC) family protein
MDLATFVMRMGTGLVLGVLMGIERQWHHRMAGPRTNALVAAASASFTMVGLITSSDPAGVSRIVGQIITGIGFLGAGVIFKEGASIHGLNTAATVWCSAAVGALSGMGHSQYAVALSIAVILTNVLLRPLAHKWRPEETNYFLELTCDSKEETKLRGIILSVLSKNQADLASLTSEPFDAGDRVRVSAIIRTSGRNDATLETVVARLSVEPSVKSVRWQVQTPVTE